MPELEDLIANLIDLYIENKEAIDTCEPAPDDAMLELFKEMIGD